jgi:hypothetical protein
LAANADVFFIEGVGYGAFRRPAVTTTEAAAGSIKAEQRRPREKREKEKLGTENRGKRQAKPREKQQKTKRDEQAKNRGRKQGIFGRKRDERPEDKHK